MEGRSECESRPPRALSRARYAPGTDLPAGYQCRAPTPHDLEAVADVLVADDLDDARQIVLDADFVRDEWSRVGFDLATDAWVVVDGGRTIVGYGQGKREEPNVVESWGVVHPSTGGGGSAPRCWTGSRSGHPT